MLRLLLGGKCRWLQKACTFGNQRWVWSVVVNSSPHLNICRVIEASDTYATHSSGPVHEQLLLCGARRSDGTQLPRTPRENALLLLQPHRQQGESLKDLCPRRSGGCCIWISIWNMLLPQSQHDHTNAFFLSVCFSPDCIFPVWHQRLFSAGM